MPTILTQIRNLDGTLRLALDKTTGYRRVTLTAPGGALWVVPTQEASYVEGESLGPTPPRRPAYSRNEIIRVFGDTTLWPDEDAYWVSLEDRIETLVEHTSTPFLWAVRDGGYLWTYRSIGPASVDPTLADREDLVARRRPVALRFKVQPHPTKTAPGGP